MSSTDTYIQVHAIQPPPPLVVSPPPCPRRPLSPVIGQKWHCVEEITGKWRIQKCKGGGLKEGPRKRARSLRPRSSYDPRDGGRDGRDPRGGCDCGGPDAAGATAAAAAPYKPSRSDRHRSQRQFPVATGQREYKANANEHTKKKRLY